MIGYTKGYVLRNVTGKTKGLQVFLDDVTKLALRAKSETDVQKHLDSGNFIIACYQKDKLRGYYCFAIEQTDCTGLEFLRRPYGHWMRRFREAFSRILPSGGSPAWCLITVI